MGINKKVEHYRTRIKNDAEDAEKYLVRRKDKHDREISLVRKVLSSLNDAKSLIDAPCGAGRMSFLAEEMGFKTTGADLGSAILACAEQEKKRLNSKVNFVSEDIEKFSFKDRQFDILLCFRFFHHLPNEEVKLRVIQELTRVSEKYVAISYLSPYSITSLKRKLKSKLFGKRICQNSTKLSELTGYFKKCGFKLSAHRFSLPFFHTLCMAVFEREVK